MPLPVIYLHGFGSSPLSYKARILSEHLRQSGRRVAVPDLNLGDFSSLTISKMVTEVKTVARNLDEPFVIIGSSLGGYTAALYAEKGDSNLKGLFLMAPAFNFAGNWAKKLGGQALSDWRKTGEIAVFHYAYNKEVRLRYAFYEDSEKLAPFPAVGNIPCAIVHGERDDVVPIELSEKFCKLNPAAKLYRLHDLHELGESVDKIATLIDGFLAEIERG
ncbi:MAG: alpha/beta fold hydrolase [Myxococcota bacterium]